MSCKRVIVPQGIALSCCAALSGEWRLHLALSNPEELQGFVAPRIGNEVFICHRDKWEPLQQIRQPQIVLHERLYGGFKVSWVCREAVDSIRAGVRSPDPIELGKPHRNVLVDPVAPRDVDHAVFAVAQYIGDIRIGLNVRQGSLKPDAVLGELWTSRSSRSRQVSRLFSNCIVDRIFPLHCTSG